MKNSKTKRLTAIMLSVFIIMTLLPLAAFAQDKTVSNINITVKKPTLNASYTDEIPDYHAKLDESCGMELVNEGWLELEDESGIGSAEFNKFSDDNTYFLLATFKVKEGYKLPKDLSKISANMNFTNAPKEAPKYVSKDEYKYENGTYTLDDDDPMSGVYLSFIYSVEIASKVTDELNIKVKAPVTDVQYSKNTEIFPEYKATIEDGNGFIGAESAWLYVGEDDKAIITEYFVPNGDYIFSVGVKLEDGYKMPEDVKDIPVTIDFDGAENITFKPENYRDPTVFNPRETGTYTIQIFKSEDGVREFDFVCAVKPNPAVEDDITIHYTKPVAGDKYTVDSEKYFAEANSADGVSVVGSLWEKKLFGPIYRPIEEFEEGKQYRLTLYLYVKEGYELPKDLKNIKFTLVDSFYNETELDSKDFKIVPHISSGKVIGYKFIYELPGKLTAPIEIPETQAPDSSDAEATTNAPEKGEETSKKDNIATPDTGAAAGTALAVIALIGVGAGLITKKRNDK